MKLCELTVQQMLCQQKNEGLGRGNNALDERGWGGCFGCFGRCTENYICILDKSYLMPEIYTDILILQ